MGLALFLVSFISLFLELLLIRWAPSLIRIVAYYGNLMLVSSFLGLGCGMLLTRRKLSLHRWFASCLLLFVISVSTMQGIEFRQGPDELRFLFVPATYTTALPIVVFFALNALLFVPLGDLVGSLFERLSPLQAYSWDLGGAIVGTILFGLFSYFSFSPVLGCIIVMVVYPIYCRSVWQFLLTTALFAISLAIVVLGVDDNAIWSPYNHITVKEVKPNGNQESVSFPAENIAALKDPPFYVIQINHDFYMSVGTIDARRYTTYPPYLLSFVESYTMPHVIRPDAKKVLVVGSGGGVDVEAALLYGAERVDAVEIDPMIIRTGHLFSASQSYKSPRVEVYNTDARAFFKQTSRTYDMVVFGLLDSQSIFSQMSNIRLDGYVYTQESFREAFNLLNKGGLLSISFYTVGKTWLLDRLVAMVRSATNTTPSVYASPTGEVMIFTGKAFAPEWPKQFVNYQRIKWSAAGTAEATDDWPYLYLSRPFIPMDYLISAGAFLLISVIFIFLSADKKRNIMDLHFFFLGAGFLLLETKSVTTISLYFGTTWFVSMVVILGVLVMVFLANLAASLVRRFSWILYLPVILSVGFLYLFPTQNVLAWSFLSRLIYSITVVPLPIFFAGLIVSFPRNRTGEK